VWISPHTDFGHAELDELWWFTNGRKDCEHGVNAFIMTELSRLPRQIAAFAAGRSVTSQAIQCVVDTVPVFAKNHTDGGAAYCGVDFIGRHCRNIRDKSETHLIEGSNADIRHYVAGLARRSRCFFRSLRTLRAVLWLFVNAYNRFGEWKMKYRLRHPKRGRDYRCSHLDFVLSA
jgi:IS1 family transposase